MKLNKIALYREGRSISGQPLTPSFSNNTYLRSYVQTMHALNYYNPDETNGITPSQWANGYTIYAFDLPSNKDVSNKCLKANLSRHLRQELSHEKVLANTINVLIHAVTESVRHNAVERTRTAFYGVYPIDNLHKFMPTYPSSSSLIPIHTIYQAHTGNVSLLIRIDGLKFFILLLSRLMICYCGG